MLCRATKRIACRPGVGGAVIPRACDAAALPGQTNQCGTDPYILLPDKSDCVDQQTLKMQVGVQAALAERPGWANPTTAS